MHYILSVLLLSLLTLGATDSCAGTAEVREVARLNNCPPKKIDVFQQTLGAEGTTTYRVECIIAKGKDENAPKTADAALIKCSGSMCELLRPINLENK